MRYVLGCYIPEGGILHSHRRENLQSYTLKDANSPTLHIVTFAMTAQMAFRGWLRLACS
jgi:hypothetical protein